MQVFSKSYAISESSQYEKRNSDRRKSKHATTIVEVSQKIGKLQSFLALVITIVDSLKPLQQFQRL